MTFARFDGPRTRSPDSPTLRSHHGIPTSRSPVRWPTYYPAARRIRATRGGDTIVDTRHALLVWELGRVPSYAVPHQDEVSQIKGHLAPYGERVDLIVDGQLQERPAGPFGRRGGELKRAA